MKKFLTATVILGLAAAAAQADMMINDSTDWTYSQNFNSLASTGTGNAWTDNSTIGGWYWQSSNAIRTPSAYGYIANTGTLTTGAGYSFGALDDADRAMGAVSAGSGANFYIGAQFRNNTTEDIALKDILISYYGEQWRQTANAQALTFSYLISSTQITDLTTGSWTARSALDFTAPQTGTAGPLDGNAAANRTFFDQIALDTSGTLAAGEYVMLAWYKTGTTSPGLAVDDFTLTVVPEPGALALLLGGLGSLLAVRRFRRR